MVYLSLEKVKKSSSPTVFRETTWRSLLSRAPDGALTLMLGGALSTKPRASKRDATVMIRNLGIGWDCRAEPEPVNSDVEIT